MGLNNEIVKLKTDHRFTYQPSWIGAWYIIANHDKPSFLAMFIMIYHCWQWSIMEDNDLQCVAF